MCQEGLVLWGYFSIDKSGATYISHIGTLGAQGLLWVVRETRASSERVSMNSFCDQCILEYQSFGVISMFEAAALPIQESRSV
jgi:hypothetical protein